MGFFKKLKKGFKKVVKGVGKVVGKVAKVAAPFAPFIPGVGPLAAAGINAVGGLLGGAQGSAAGAYGATPGINGGIVDSGGGNNPFYSANGINWGNIANVAGVATSLFNNPKTPKAPNYTNLATQQASQQAALLRQQTVANRPNQINSFGSSSWEEDPTTGQWTQTTNLNAADQARLDASRQIQGGLMSQAAGSLSKPLDFSGLPNAQFNMDPTGNNEAVQNATYALTATQRRQQREDEIQRLRSAGLPEDSAAFQRAIARLDDSDRMAMNESLLAGRTDYGNSFNRGLNQSQNNQELRTQGIEEQNAAALSPLQRIQALSASTPTIPQFGNFATAGEAQAPDLMGAAGSQYAANVNAYNNKVAKKNSKVKGLFGLGGALGNISTNTGPSAPAGGIYAN